MSQDCGHDHSQDVTPDRIIHDLLMALVALVILEGFGILWLVIALHRIMAELRLS